MSEGPLPQWVMDEREPRPRKIGMSTHKKWSLWKSGLRFVACLAPCFGPAGGIAWIAAWLAAAEALGIAEEIGEP